MPAQYTVRKLDHDSRVDCWINYSTSNKDVVDAVMKHLWTRHDIQCWNFEHIHGGRSSWQEIGTGMDRARKILTFWTQAYLESNPCQYEFGMAMNDLNEGGNLKIIPIRLDDVKIPREQNALHVIDGRRKTPEEIAEDCAFAFKHGAAPAQIVHNGKVVAFQLEGLCRVKCPSTLGIGTGIRQDLQVEMKREDIAAIVEKLDETPWLRDNYRLFSCTWVFFLILLSLGTGAAFGFTIGSFYTLLIKDPQLFLVTNSVYSLVACPTIFLIGTLVYWGAVRPEEKRFLSSVLREINDKVNPVYNLLFYIDPNQCCCPVLMVYKFDMKKCKKIIESHLGHVIRGVSEESRDDPTGVPHLDLFLQENTLLWQYINKYPHTYNYERGRNGGHFVLGYKCFCTFVYEKYQDRWRPVSKAE